MHHEVKDGSVYRTAIGRALTQCLITYTTVVILEYTVQAKHTRQFERSK